MTRNFTGNVSGPPALQDAVSAGETEVGREQAAEFISVQQRRPPAGSKEASDQRLSQRRFACCGQSSQEDRAPGLVAIRVHSRNAERHRSIMAEAV